LAPRTWSAGRRLAAGVDEEPRERGVIARRVKRFLAGNQLADSL
jgi:hypothetical protein